MVEQERFEIASRGIRKGLQKKVTPQYQSQRLTNRAVSNLSGTTRVELKELITFIETRQGTITDELERIAEAEERRSKLREIFGNRSTFDADREQMMNEFKLCVIINNACLRMINTIDNEEERRRRMQISEDILPMDREKKKA